MDVIPPMKPFHFASKSRTSMREFCAFDITVNHSLNHNNLPKQLENLCICYSPFALIH